MTRREDVPDASSMASMPPASHSLSRPTHDRAVAVLLARVAAGETNAFAELYDDTSPRVYGLALRIVRDSAEAEEVAQESYLQIWRIASRFDPRRGSAISWILMITHAAAVDRVRSTHASTRREHTYEHQAQRLALVSPDTTHDLACTTFEATRVRGALSGLSALQREALVLAYFGGFTQPEIAVRLGVPLGTAKTRVRDGLIGLRACLEERGVSKLG